jgi:ribosomal subunit interface protein
MLHTQISYDGIECSTALTDLIGERARHVERLSDRIISLRVVVAAPHHHHRHGNLYQVRIELAVPGRARVIVDRGDEDVYQAVRQAFEALERRLATAQSRWRGKQRAQADRRAPLHTPR